MKKMKIKNSTSISASGYKGIEKRADQNRFRARVQIAPEMRVTVGQYLTLDEAIVARQSFIESLF